MNRRLIATAVGGAAILTAATVLAPAAGAAPKKPGIYGPYKVTAGQEVTHTSLLKGVAAPAPMSVDGPVSLRDLDTTTVYTKPVAGKCKPGWVKTVNKKTQKVTWQWKNGNVSSKVIKKGIKVCKYTDAKGQTGTGTYNAAGVLTALPTNFPANPTVADIAALGLTKDSKVAPGLRIPRPAQASTPARLADTVTPVRAWKGEQRYLVSYTDGVETYGTRTVVYVEWAISGGSGVLEYRSADGLQAVALKPNGTILVTRSGAPDDRNVFKFAGSGIAPDYGQADLPPSMVKGWDNRDVYAKDASGIGSPIGVHAN